MNKKMIEAIQNEEWTVSVYDGGIDFAWYTPAGEDYSFSVDGGSSSSVAGQIIDHSAAFDVDEHVLMWLQASPMGQPGARALVEDAEAIEAKLRELADVARRFL